MATEKIKEALSSKGDKARRKLHSQSVNYHRADNGGIHAHVERHTGDGKHHHTEHHVLASVKDAHDHLDEHLGDQPDAGQGMPPQEAAPPPGAPGAGGGAPGGGMPMPGGGAEDTGAMQ